MIRFAVVMIIVGLVTSFFFDAETALKVGLKVMDWWILAGLVIALLTPIFNIGKFILSSILKIYFCVSTVFANRANQSNLNRKQGRVKDAD